MADSPPGAAHRRRLTHRATLVATHLGLVALVAVTSLVVLHASLGRELRVRAEQRLEAQARGAAEWVGEGRHPRRLASRLAVVVGARVTIFDDSGRVLGDSDAAAAAAEGEEATDAGSPERGAVEPEVRAALAGRTGHDVRPAQRGSGLVQFTAVPASDGNVVRLAESLDEIDAAVALAQGRLAVVSVAGLAVALGLAWAAAAWAARPLRAMTAAAERIARGEYDVPVATDSPDEFGTLSRMLAHVASEIGAVERMRREFVADASHELRTPVQAIGASAETLLARPLDAENTRRFAEVIHRHSLRLGRLVDDLLRLAELEGRAPRSATRGPVPLGRLAHDVARALEDRARSRGARIEVVADAPVVALADAESLAQVLENLVDNALKYAVREGGSVRLVVGGGAGRVRVEVVDEGPGIAAEHLPRVFERFYRVDPGRSRALGGTGLGLAIVERLVDAMGGRVTVTSEPGRGTTFKVELDEA